MLQAKQDVSAHALAFLFKCIHKCMLPTHRWADSLVAELVAGATARPLLSGYYRVAAVLLRLAEAGGLLGGGGEKDGAKSGDVVQGCALAQVRRGDAVPCQSTLHFDHSCFASCSSETLLSCCSACAEQHLTSHWREEARRCRHQS
jgi:hypothetical protein